MRTLSRYGHTNVSLVMFFCVVILIILLAMGGVWMRRGGVRDSRETTTGVSTAVVEQLQTEIAARSTELAKVQAYLTALQESQKAAETNAAVAAQAPDAAKELRDKVDALSAQAEEQTVLLEKAKGDLEARTKELSGARKNVRQKEERIKQLEKDLELLRNELQREIVSTGDASATISVETTPKEPGTEIKLIPARQVKIVKVTTEQTGAPAAFKESIAGRRTEERQGTKGTKKTKGTEVGTEGTEIAGAGTSASTGQEHGEIEGPETSAGDSTGKEPEEAVLGRPGRLSKPGLPGMYRGVKRLVCAPLLVPYALASGFQYPLREDPELGGTTNRAGSYAVQGATAPLALAVNTVAGTGGCISDSLRGLADICSFGYYGMYDDAFTDVPDDRPYISQLIDVDEPARVVVVEDDQLRPVRDTQQKAMTFQPE